MPSALLRLVALALTASASLPAPVSAQDADAAGAGLTVAELVRRSRAAVEEARFEEAVPLERARLAALRAKYPEDHEYVRDGRLLLETFEALLAGPSDGQLDYAAALRLRGEAWTLGRQGDYAGALAAAEASLGKLVPLVGEGHLDVVVAHAEVGRWLFNSGRQAEGLAELELAATAALEHLPGHSVEGSLHDRWGAALLRAGRHAAAEAALLHARDVFRAAPVSDHTRTTNLNNLASLFEAQGRLTESLAMARESARIASQIYDGRGPDFAASLNNLAMIQVDAGHFVEAEILMSRALTVYTEALGAAHPRVADLTLNLGFVHGRAGRHATALEHFQRAVDLYGRTVGPGHPNVAWTLNQIATTLMQSGQLEQALQFATEAATRLEAHHGPIHPHTLGSKGRRVDVLDRLGRADEAERAARELLAVQREHDAEPAGAAQRLAQLLLRRGQLDEAEELAREALALREDGEVTDPVLVSTLGTLGEVLLTRGVYAEAVSVLDRAAELAESIRQPAVARVDRAGERRPPVLLRAVAQLQDHDPEGAWIDLERSRGRALLDLLAAASAHGDRRLTGMRRRAAELESQLTALPADDPTGATLRAELLRTRAIQLALEHPEPAGTPAPDLAAVQARLDPSTALLGWLDPWEGGPFDRGWIWVLRDAGPPRFVPGPAPGGEAEQRLRDALAEAALSPFGSPVDERLRQLAGAVHQQRIEPAAELLDGVRHLVVVPSGAMVGVPAEALWDGHGFLGEALAVSYAPSATVWSELVGRPARPAGRAALLLGDPPFRVEHLADARPAAPGAAEVAMRSAPMQPGALPRLPASRDEVEQLAALFDEALALLGPDASEASLEPLLADGALARFDTVHVATHALVDGERPERSALVLSQVDLPDALAAVLSGERVQDGLLTVAEILAEWRLDADLVTLSACDTGLGRAVAGEGYVGFAQAFLQAGARSLLVSLWEVDDAATARLMVAFYHARLGSDERPPMSKGAALRHARRTLREWTDERGRRPYEHPCFWSAFVLVGTAD